MTVLGAFFLSINSVGVERSGLAIPYQLAFVPSFLKTFYRVGFFFPFQVVNFLGLWYKLPQTGLLKTTKMYSLTVLDFRSQNEGVARPPRSVSSRKGWPCLFWLLGVAGSAWHAVRCKHIAAAPASTLTRSPRVSACLYVQIPRFLGGYCSLDYLPPQPSVTWLSLQRPHFKIKSHSQVLSEHEFGGTLLRTNQ